MEANLENAADEDDGTKHRDDDVVPHAERNLGDISGAAGDQNLERTAIPAFVRALARNAFTSCISFWQSKAPMLSWLVTSRKTRIVRSGEVSGWSSSIAALLAKGFSAGAITPSGSSAKLELRPRRAGLDFLDAIAASAPGFLPAAGAASVSSKAAGSRLSRSGTAIDCRSRTPSGVSIGEPARTRLHHGCWRNDSANCRREFLQLIDIVRLADERESQIARPAQNRGCKL